MTKKTNIQYYVEGDDEKKLIDVLKRDMRCIQVGRVDKFNAIQNLFTTTRIRTLKQNTVIVLIYDTDVEKIDILQKNITYLRKQSTIKDIICIPQVKKLEEELLYACKIKKIEDLTHSQTSEEFKRDIIKCNNLKERLEKCQFDISKFWCRIPSNQFKIFGNDADKIKLKNA